MKIRFLLVWLGLLSCAWAQAPSAASISTSLQHLTIDPDATYHVRDLRFARGGVTFYLNDGYLAFAKPVSGQPVAAIFSTSGIDTGDAELIVTPPSRGERVSLAYFTKTPNLDEHFGRAIFFFSDDLRSELARQIEQNEARKVQSAAPALASEWDQPMRNIATGIEVPLIRTLLNPESASNVLFFASIGGKTLGPFQMSYTPSEPEAVAIGREVENDRYEIWTSFNEKKPAVPPRHNSLQVKSYQIEATVQPDLKVSAVTRLHAVSRSSGDRAIQLEVSRLMRVAAVTINGEPAEVFQPDTGADPNANDVGQFVIVSPKPLAGGASVELEIRHEGKVILDEGEGVYFVEARNIWFPHVPFESATFDLTFRCPAALRLISSGRLVNETVDGQTRTVHRVLESPTQFVGFNLGDFDGVTRDQAPFHVEFYVNRSMAARMAQAGATSDAGIHSDNSVNAAAPAPSGQPAAISGMLTPAAERTTQILSRYSTEWGPAPTANISVTPIPGSFGQGFPGLIYLSNVFYLPEPLRSPAIRDSILNTLYSQVLLPHEIAHQWWGNLVLSDDYRSSWLMEGLSNYVALQLLESEGKSTVVNDVLKFYAGELTRSDDQGRFVESKGPLNLGLRIRASNGMNAWRIITYDKGTWVIRMLQKRMGAAAFAKLLKTLATDYAYKELSNEQFRSEAARFMPKGDSDDTLEEFFDAWVYRTGIPRLSLQKTNDRTNEYVLRQDGVDNDFSVDVPITINSPGKQPILKWVRTSAEGTPFSAGAARSAQASLPLSSDFLYLSN